MQYKVHPSAVLIAALLHIPSASGFAPASLLRNPSFASPIVLHAEDGESPSQADAEASRLRARAEELREEIRKAEAELGDSRGREYTAPPPDPSTAVAEPKGMSLKKKRVLVVGANGRVGSMVCRHLLRTNPETEVVAAVHYVGERTSRGYGRLSYEVGAEDGRGTIGSAWSSEDRNASFEYVDEMADYNLQNLRVVDVELLDPVQCMTITEDVDSVVWCATDFDGNRPRAIASLNAAFLFRAVADPTKGRVEIEGLRNILGGLKQGKQNRNDLERGPNDPISFVLISAEKEAFGDFETPFGSFIAIKREGEEMIRKEFPSLSHCILQMSKFDDNFIEEGLEILRDNGESEEDQKFRRRINRRDAARAVSEALTDETLVDQTVELWTQKVGR